MSAQTGPVTLPRLPDLTHVHRNGWGQPIIQTGEERPSGGLRSALCKSCDKQVPGVGYRRCTTFIDVLEDKSQLMKWKQRQVARGLAARNALVLAAAAAGDDSRKLNQICEDAMQAAGSSDAATLGTAVHAFTEQHDRGQMPAVPPSARPDVDAYIEATKNMRMLDVETFVVHDRLRVAGTFDRLVEIDGRRYIADIKTGSIEYGLAKIGMQLAVYGESERYNVATGERTPLDVDEDFGLIIHLPAGQARCDLVWVNLNMGRLGVQLAAQVWDWRDQSKSIASDGPASRHDALRELIPLTGNAESLEQLWRDNEDVWDDELTALAKIRRAQFEAAS
jgi:hypothetical protein